ncbi:MAG: carbonic anhydrase [Methylotetracoccus sp.]
MRPIERLLLENKAWAQENVAQDPQFFEKLSDERSCQFFWIGCSDSRVHADEITNTEPGRIFVHRNIANLVVNSDMALLSALEYAVDHLRVEHIIVCGHYGCGGIEAAMRKAKPLELMLNKWLKHIKDIYRLHRNSLEMVSPPSERQNRLVELNVIEQVHNLAQTSTVQRAWATRAGPELHGWVYGLHDGIIRELVHLDAGTPMDPLYEYEIESQP